MLSRSAEAAYWMARYAERAENVARFLDVSLQVMLDLPDPHRNPWDDVILATGDRVGFEARHGVAARDAVVQFLTIDSESPNSILNCLLRARENARSIRDAISSEMWEQINKWYLFVRDYAVSRSATRDTHELLAAVKEASHLFVGATYLTMTHGEAWHFGRLGRLLERADQTSRIVEAKEMLLSRRVDAASRPADTGLDGMDLSALLRSVSALEMYRKAYGPIEHRNVIAFLALDHRFPRSLRYCLENAHESLSAIVGASPNKEMTTRPERLLGRLAAEYRYVVVDEILDQGIQAHMDALQHKLNFAGSAIFDAFFATRTPSLPEQALSTPQEDQAAQATQ